MFIIQNNQITNEKVLEVGPTFYENVIFNFADVEFEETDKFTLTIAGHESSLYGFTEQGYLRFTLFNFTWLDSESTTAAIVVKKGDTIIVSDSITLVAVGDSPAISYGQDIVVLTSPSFTPEDDKIYKYTLSANDIIAINTTGLTADKVINFELHLIQPATAVSFTLPNNLTWYDNGVFNSINNPPAFTDGGSLYAVSMRWNGSALLANLSYIQE